MNNLKVSKVYENILLAQGEMIDRIEYPVEHTVDYVQPATRVLNKHLDNHWISFLLDQQILKNSFPKWWDGFICAGHKEGAEVSVESATGEKIL